MKRILLLLTLPLLLTACAYDTYHYPAGYNVHAAPAPRYYPNNNYHQSYQQPKTYYAKPAYKEQRHNHEYNEHHDNGKHKGKHKNKHHDDD